MMDYNVDVAIVGAGTAGLSALSEVRKKTDSFLLINGGELGTTCARVGCMPSKVLIQTANDYFRRINFPARGIHGQDHLRIDGNEVLSHLRMLRDGFVKGVVGHFIEPTSDKLLVGYAEFLEPNLLQVGRDKVRAKAIILATGTRPMVPEKWTSVEDHIWTYENVFEQPELPESVGIIGLGAIGIELGQALHRMGVQVTGFDLLEKIGGLENPEVSKSALERFGKAFPIHLGAEVDLKKDGSRVTVVNGGVDVTVDKVLVGIGGIPNTDMLRLDRIGVKLDERGIPPFDTETMQVNDLPLFIAGDVNGFRPVLHEASDEGRVAGYNAVHDPLVRLKRKPPLSIAFCEPNICSVGASWNDVKDAPPALGTAFFKGGRAKIMGKEGGMMAVYGDPAGGRIWGAEILGPEAEHLAHLLAWGIQQKLTVFDLLEMPFYHPTIEETLEGALKDMAKNVTYNGNGERPMRGLRVKQAP